MKYFLVGHAEAHAASKVVWDHQDQLGIPRTTFELSSVGMYACISCTDPEEAILKEAFDSLEIEYEEGDEPPESPWTEGLFID